MLTSIHKLKCAYCGEDLVGTTRHNRGEVKTVYRCPSHAKGEDGCPLKEIDTQYIDKFVTHYIVQEFFEKDDKEIQSLARSVREGNTREILEGELVQVENRIANLTNAISMKPSSSLCDKLAKLEDEAQEIRTQLEVLSTPSKTFAKCNKAQLAKKLRKYIRDNDLPVVKNYLNNVINKVTVSNDSLEFEMNTN